MNKSLKIIIWLLPVIISTVSIGRLKAQNLITNIKELETSFINTVTGLYQEKVFIHTDRAMYVTGETIWLKPYCVDATFHTLSNVSKVINIELIDMNGIVVKQERVQLDKGIGEGQIFVSPNMQSGTYVLRGFTNWMKNFSSDYVFKKEISIINPSSSTIKREENFVEKEREVFIQFFPEGGDLVQNLESKIAVKIIDKLGEGLSLTGVVFDNEENEVAKFTTSELGYSSFQLLPVRGMTYKARVSYKSTLVTKEISAPRTLGIVVSTKLDQSGDFNISVTSTQDYLQTMYLVIHSRGLIKKIEPLYLGLGQNLKIKKADLETGISHITILDKNFRPAVERLIFKYPKTTQQYNVRSNKKIYAKRERVNLIIESDNSKALSNLSVSVFRADSSLQITDNIVSNLLLSSDLNGTIENPAYYFDRKTKNKENQIDLLMLTNGWRRFEWGNIVNQTPRNIEFTPEMFAPIISGRFLGQNGLTFPDFLQISLSGRSSFLNSVELDSEGKFKLEVPFRVKNKKAIVFTANTLIKDQIEWDSPFEFQYTTPVKGEFKLNLNLKTYAEVLNTNVQISQLYRETTKINGADLEQVEVTTGFWGSPDNTYLLDNYTRFESVEDLFIEYIRFAYIKTKDKKKTFYVLNEKGVQVEALVTIDGVPIFDSEFILGFDPLLIEEVSMVNDTYYIGERGYEALLNFTTYKGDFGNKELPENLVQFAYNAIQAPRIFYSPNYSISHDNLKRVPDYRNTLYWNSNILLNETDVHLQFNASDEPGLYQIQMEGISSEGMPISIVKFFIID